MTSREHRLTFPVLLVISCTCLIQIHGWQFWLQQAGTSGPIWSVVLEAAALWLWWHSSRLVRFVGLVGTLVVLSGPLFVLSQPAVSAWQAAQAQRQEAVALRSEIASLEATREAFVQNSRQRAGWLPAIERVQARIEHARERLRVLSSQRHDLPIQTIARIAIEVLGLLVVVVAQVSAIRHVAGVIEERRAREAKEIEAKEAARRELDKLFDFSSPVAADTDEQLFSSPQEVSSHA